MVAQPTARNRIRKALISLTLIVAALVVVVLVARMPTPVADVPEPQVIPVEVEVLTVDVQREMVDILRLPAAVEPVRVVEVPVEQRGRIERILLKEGDLVQEGDILLELDSALLKAEVERARAQADYDSRMLTRALELLEKGFVKRSEVDELEARSIVSRSTLDIALTNLDRATVRVPLTGVLDDLIRERGEYVAVGDPVAKIVEVSRVKVAVEVPERDIRFLRKGQTITVSVDALEGRRFSGQVTYLSEVADPATRSTRVEITLDNRSDILHAGMIVRAEIGRQVLRDVILIPLSAVIPLEEGRVVYVVEENVAQRREVMLGLIRGTQVQVLDGLKAGDLLILRGNRLVGPGQPVNVIQAG